MVSPPGRAGGVGGGPAAPPPPPPPQPARGNKARLLSREELSDIEYLFDRLSAAEEGKQGAGPDNSPLPLPISPAEPGTAARGGGEGESAAALTLAAAGGNGSSSGPPTVGFAQLKFALRAFGLPVRKGDVVALLQRHGYVPGGGGGVAGRGEGVDEEEQEGAAPAADASAAADAAAGALRLTRPAFRELVGHALRDGLPGGRQDDMARAFALLDRGDKGRVTRDDVAAAAAAALGPEGAAALGGPEALADMLGMFVVAGGHGAAEGGVSLGEFAAGMSAVSLGRTASLGGGGGGE